MYTTSAVVKSMQFRDIPSSEVEFPINNDLVNFSKRADSSSIKIPISLIQERMEADSENQKFIMPDLYCKTNHNN